MVELVSIRDYVEKMAYIMSIILEMDVLICDTSLRILGDFDHEGETCKDIEILNESSIITKAMIDGSAVVYENSKEESTGCRTCLKRLECRTESIIAYPIKKGEIVIGGIGVYSQDIKQKDKLQSHRQHMIAFIENIAQLILSKLEEEEENMEIMVSRQKMKEMIESINFAIVSIDEKCKISHYNKKFKSLFGVNKINGNNDFEEVFAEIGSTEAITFVKESTKQAEKNFVLKQGKKLLEYEITVLPTIIGGIYKGALVYLRETREVYAKANQLLNHVSTMSFDDIIGESIHIKQVKNEAKSFSSSSSSVMIHGESGTGKEIFAGAIHSNSKFCDGPFVTVNCAAIPDNLLESELFGHEEGSFTGSMKGGRVGKFELANNGTLFLDEIGELPIHLQPKLLRALQERQIQRIGSNRSIDINIRIIAATNRNLEDMMATGQFREDLYYRLNVIPIHIPALRNRKEDIPILLNYFLQMYKDMLSKNEVLEFSKSSIELLCEYQWPGNVRELQNAVEYAVNKCEGVKIKKEDLPAKVVTKVINENREYTAISIKELETQAIVEAIRHFGNTLEGKENAAKSLGISRATMYGKLSEINL